MVAEETNQCSEIELPWREVGLSLQVQFIKKNYVKLEIGGNDSASGGNERLKNKKLLIYTIKRTISSCEFESLWFPDGIVMDEPQISLHYNKV